MDVDTKLKKRLHKIMALADRGVGGEKTTAEKILSDLLEKHSLAIADITGEETEIHWFKYKGQLQRKLLNQIIRAATDGREVDFWKNRRKREVIGADVSMAEMVEIELMFFVYSKSLAEDVETLLTAFVYKNDIYPPSEEFAAAEDLTKEERERRWRVANMVDSVSRPEIRKQIVM